MPIPSPKGKEDKSSFISRCVSELSKKGEGESGEQRVAICNSKWRKAKSFLTAEEARLLDFYIKTA